LPQWRKALFSHPLTQHHVTESRRAGRRRVLSTDRRSRFVLLSLGFLICVGSLNGTALSSFTSFFAPTLIDRAKYFPSQSLVSEICCVSSNASRLPIERPQHVGHCQNSLQLPLTKSVSPKIALLAGCATTRATAPIGGAPPLRVWDVSAGGIEPLLHIAVWGLLE
jgi:hypothetical protein